MVLPTRPAPTTWTRAWCNRCWPTAPSTGSCAANASSYGTDLWLLRLMSYSLRIDLHRARCGTQQRCRLDPLLQIGAVAAGRHDMTAQHDEVGHQRLVLHEVGVFLQQLHGRRGYRHHTLARTPALWLERYFPDVPRTHCRRRQTMDAQALDHRPRQHLIQQAAD